MTRRYSLHRRLARLAVGVNAAAAVGCAALVAMAPDRPAAFVAAGGLVFFALAAVGFWLMLRVESTKPRDA